MKPSQSSGFSMSARFSAKRCLLLFVVGLAPLSVVAQEQPKTTVSGFVDVYYCYDFSRPLSRDRSFTTQPMRHNEFTLNLGMIDVKYQAVNIRGRFAFQTGTYVQSNLAAEPSLLRPCLSRRRRPDRRRLSYRRFVTGRR